MANGSFDICIIGGGINGTGIARDAAGHGLSVLLLEKNDIASATSSASSKIIHGGLRYLEQYEFSLVRKALKEREILLTIAPHIIEPLDFIIPHVPSMRPKWMIKAGLFLYDHLSTRRKLTASKNIKFCIPPYSHILKPEYKSGFLYADAWCDDSRISVLNAVDAKEKGAQIKTYTACTHIEPKGQHWLIHYGENETALAKTIVNAAGPWTKEFLDQNNITNSDTPNIRLIKGSHIIVPKLYEGAHAYTLQQPDERVVFTFPYLNKYTLIGTTDVEISLNDPVKIDKNEINYLLSAANNFFEKQLTHRDITSSYSGIRPLLDSGNSSASEITRDYHLHLDRQNNQHVLSVFGGKITTFRALAEDVINTLKPILKFNPKSWTDTAPLPGGDIQSDFLDRAIKEHREWPQAMTTRLAKAYGSRLRLFPKDAGKIYDNLTCTAEIEYSIQYELTKTLEDFLWRRTKLGLLLKPETINKLEIDFMKTQSKLRAQYD